MTGSAAIVSSNDLTKLLCSHLMFAYLKERTYYSAHHIP
jgi:hypothetical protein